MMAKKLGICLTGGGARGGYQIGALKALEDLGILKDVKAYAGTSIGSANAAVVASRSVDKAKDVWLNLPDDSIPKNAYQTEVKDDTKKRLIDMERGIYSLKTFEDTIIKAVDFKALKKKEVYATISHGGDADEGIFDLMRSSFAHYIKKEAKVYYMPLHELDAVKVQKSIVASCSIPVLFAPVTLEAKKYYDGGMFDNIPIKPLIDSGCDEIIIIHLHKHRFYKPQTLAPKVLFHEIKHVEGYLGRVMHFSKEHTLKLYELGYQDTMQYFKKQEGEG